MRDILEDAHAHNDAGIGRAQKPRIELPRRFYKQVTVAKRDSGYAVLLDGRVTKTPGKTEVAVPNAVLAEKMAAEWDAQETHINPMTMPLVRLINSGVEGGEEAAGPLAEEIVKFATNDLLLYRADSPRELVETQNQHWDSALTALARHFGIKFRPVIGIIHQDQPAQTLKKLSQSLDETHHLTLTALMSITGLTGSGLLAIALREGLIEPEPLWTAAHVDEDHNIRLWGEDAEAAARRARRKQEFDAAVTVLREMERG